MSNDAYFDSSASARALGAVGRFERVDGQPPIEAAPGVVLRAITGDNVMISWVTIAPHSAAAVHSHDEEQLGVVVSGACDFELDGQTRHVGAGDVYVAPPGVPHGVRTGAEACVIIDVFSPPRQALLALLADERPTSG